MDFSPWGSKESDMTEQLSTGQHLNIKIPNLSRNLYAAQEATVRTGHGTTDWFQIGKRVLQGCICHPDYLTYMQSTS